MKRSLFAVVVFGFFALLYSCTKDQARKPFQYDCSTVDLATNTYNLRIKEILDLKCATSSCHNGDAANLANVASVDLHDYANAKITFESKDAICAINHGEGCTAMPDGIFGPTKLADSLITYLQCWSDHDYPQ